MSSKNHPINVAVNIFTDEQPPRRVVTTSGELPSDSFVPGDTEIRTTREMVAQQLAKLATGVPLGVYMYEGVIPENIQLFTMKPLSDLSGIAEGYQLQTIQ